MKKFMEFYNSLSDNESAWFTLAMIISSVYAIMTLVNIVGGLINML